MQLYRFIVSGKVQGVFYRKSVSQNAMKAGYRGTVKNLNDGTVEVYAELLDDEISGFLELLREGSPTSVVHDISYVTASNERLEYDGFIVL
ncbi:MAG: acylphosphatase [Sulfurovaceae bacterium]|nr:acylphosphatase [Sulfurovaceae bacterium]